MAETMKLGWQGRSILERLQRLDDEHPHAMGWWKTIFIGTHSAAVCRRTLSPRGFVEIKKLTNGYRYRLTDAGRRALSEGGEQ